MDGCIAPRLVLNDVTVNLSAGTLQNASGSDIPLRAQSFAVLRELVRQRGRVVGKDALIDAVWKGTAVTDDSLVQCIGDIRRALGDKNRVLLKTVPRRGYRLVLPIDDVPAVRPPRGSMWHVLGLVALLCFVIVAFWPRTTSRLPDPPRVAVLPFVNLGADPSVDSLGKGVAEDIISMLAQSAGVAVIARNSSFKYGQGPVDVRQIGHELDADYVLDGSVRKSGDSLRIVAQLSDATTGRSMWSQRFDRTASGSSIQHDDVTSQIISSLIGEKSEIKRAQYRQAWESQKSSLGEFDYYLRGLDLYADAEDSGDNDRAGAVWAEGLRHFPNSTLLKVKLGWYHLTAYRTYRDKDADLHAAKAAELVREVLAADDLSFEVRRDAYWLNAFVLMQSHDFDFAVRQAQEAVALSPYDGRMLNSLAEVLVCAGDYRTALGWIDQAAAWDPQIKTHSHAHRGNAYRLMGRHAQAVIEFQQVPDLSAYMNLSAAISLMQLGKPAEARRWVASASGMQPRLTLSRWAEGDCYRDPQIIKTELAFLSRAGLAN
ncbi:winged helix-turn-helix domain-containing protein [Paracoccus aestuariivivens]|uniref:OmpR/PhoB-type domain-containing protein n=1 Tax=Paracoccus aestuariivivens TaxID=1820333 RepID=A0A6L6J8E0_9RHOB|nr:winged helix-turn-helix domain-containing protein [Paracoccus aestuariivivens]MTH76897.1 hypothetical protein [Paracoccus aestuariivivens]